MRKLIFGFLFLFVVGALWSSAWVYAAHEANARLETWLKAEDAQGRGWTCPDRSTGGYPISLTIRCREPSFTGGAAGRTVRGAVSRFDAEWSIVHPRNILVTLRSPLVYKASDGSADLKADWSDLTIDIGALSEIGTIALRGTGLSVSGTFGETGAQGGTAARLEARFAEGRRGSGPTLDFTIAVQGAPVAAIDDLLGTRNPVDILLAGSLNRADVADARTPEEAIEAWRLAGGQVDLAQSRLDHGDAGVSGSGSLRLDDAHRPEGRLDASLRGLDPVLRRYGINGNLAAAGSLLNTLFGGGRRQSAPDVPDALNLPIVLQDGRLGIGPVRTPVTLPPLY